MNSATNPTDEDGFKQLDTEEFVRRAMDSYDELRRLAYRIAGDQHLNADPTQCVVNAVFVAARKRGQCEKETFEGAMAWLRSILINLVKERIRKRRLPTVSLEAADRVANVADPGAAARIEQQEQLERVREWISEQDDEDQLLFYEKWIAGATTKELAELLSLSEVGVRQRVRRLRLKLAEWMRNNDIPEGFVREGT